MRYGIHTFKNKTRSAWWLSRLSIRLWSLEPHIRLHGESPWILSLSLCPHPAHTHSRSKINKYIKLKKIIKIKTIIIWQSKYHTKPRKTHYPESRNLSREKCLLHTTSLFYLVKMPPSSAFIPTFSHHILTIFSHLVHSHVRLQSLNSERYPTAGIYIDSEFWVVETAVQTVKVHLKVYLNVSSSGGQRVRECSQWNHKRTCSFPRGLSCSSRYSHPSYVVAWRRRGRTFLCR